MKSTASFIALAVLLTSAVIPISYLMSKKTIQGTWNVSYQESKATSKIEIKEKQGKLVGYMTQYVDEKGKKQQFKELCLTNFSFTPKKVTAIYKMTYEGKKYEVEAEFKLLNANKMEVTYSYYGYKMKENWVRDLD